MGSPAGRHSVLNLGGVPREQKMPQGHLPRVIYHQVYLYTKTSTQSGQRNFQGFGVWVCGVRIRGPGGAWCVG